MSPSVLSNTKYRCVDCNRVEDIEKFPHKCRCGSGAWEQVVIVRVCDFCSTNLDLGEGFTHVCKPFAVMSLGPEPAWASGRTQEAANWLACPTCHELITRNDRQGLALRSVEKLTELHPEDMRGEQGKAAFATIAILHDGFFGRATGEWSREAE